MSKLSQNGITMIRRRLAGERAWLDLPLDVVPRLDEVALGLSSLLPKSFYARVKMSAQMRI